MKDVPTHEWIAKTLAEAHCTDPACAERALIAHAPSAVSAARPEVRRHIFLFAGWAHFGEPPSLRPYIATVANMRDASGKPTSTPLNIFNASRRFLREEEKVHFDLAGETITTARAENLEENFRRLIGREIGPKEALRLLVDEIINTSKRASGVGSKILGFCIPKKAAQRFFEKGESGMLATQPNTETTAFTYFEEGYSELEQYGPTVVCGEWAVTDVKTENDPSRDFQSSEFRFLSGPKPASSTGKR
jgi:hypothetical protein